MGGASSSMSCDIRMDDNEVIITEDTVHNETSGVNKHNVDLTQVLLSNQMLIKQQADLIKSMSGFVGQNVSENSQDESDDDLGSYGMDKLDEMSVVNDDVDLEQAGEDDLEVFMVNDEKFADKIDDNLAKIINDHFHEKVPKDKVRDLTTKYLAPDNCKNMVVPRVNTGVWKALKGQPKVRDNDAKLQKSQGFILKAFFPLIGIMNKLRKSRADTLNKKDLVELKQLSNDTFKLMNIAFCDISYRRRFLIQPHLQRDYADVCADTVPVTKLLFGDDLSKTITDTEATNKIAKAVSRNKTLFPKKNDMKAPKSTPSNPEHNSVVNHPHPYNRRFAYLAKTPQSTRNTGTQNKQTSDYGTKIPNFLGKGQSKHNKQT